MICQGLQYDLHVVQEVGVDYHLVLLDLFLSKPLKNKFNIKLQLHLKHIRSRQSHSMQLN